MDENRVSGTDVGGKIEEGLGRVTGDTKIRPRRFQLIAS